MRIMRLGPLFALAVFFSTTAIHAQETTVAPRDAQAVILLQRSLAALLGTTTINDVTLSGSANWIAGSDNETGTVTLKATAIGQGRIDLSLTNGPRSEVRNISVSPSTGSWCGPDRTWHPIASHNLWSDPTWYFPAFLLARVLANSGYVVSPADAETMNGIAVEHIAVSQEYAASRPLSATLRSVSAVDIYLSSSNLLPAAIAFKIHSDDDALTNILVRVEFSDYRSVQRSQVSYHVSRYLNNGLVLDVEIETVQFNSGLSASDFTAQ